MKLCSLRRIIPIAFCAFGMLVIHASARVYPGQNPQQSEIVKGVVTVRFEDNVDVSRFSTKTGKLNFAVPSFDARLQSLGIERSRPIFYGAKQPAPNSGEKDLTRYYNFYFPETVDVQTVITELMKDPNVRVAEPVQTVVALATPNDPQRTSQWHMNPPGPDPNVYSAWDLETGSDSIVVAVMDTGELWSHPDLIGNIWVNRGEDVDNDGEVYDTDDLNGVDNDGNGVVDDLIGYDFFTGLGSPMWAGEDAGGYDPNPTDFAGHGTHVSGIVAAMNNNAVNVTGMAGGWYGGHRSFRGVRIMCLRFAGLKADGQGAGNIDDAATCIYYAAQNGASVINYSFAGGSYYQPLADAIDYAISHGVSFMHSAGNDNISTPSAVDNRPGVMAVAATNSSDHKASFSSYGTWVDISAPGQSILSTVSNFGAAGTATYDGTSMAAPCVAGLFALIKSMMPSLTRFQIDSMIMATADNIDALNPSYAGMLGTGRINAFTALSSLANAKFTGDITVGNVPFTVNFTDQSPNSPTTWDWSFGDGGTSTTQSPSHLYTAPGMYKVGLKINEPRGLGEEWLKNYIWARADTLRIDSVLCKKNTQVVVPVYLTNTSPIKEVYFSFVMQNSAGVTFDSASVVGLRTSYFEVVEKIASVPSAKKYCIHLKSNLSSGSKYLQPGNSPILKLFCKVSPTAIWGATVPFDTAQANIYPPKMSSIWGDFWPINVPGKVVIKKCDRGDTNCDNAPIDITDLYALVDDLMGIGPSTDPYAGNVDAIGGTDISDVFYLLDYLIGIGPPPPPGNTP